MQQKTTDAAEILRRRYADDGVEARAREYRESLDVARQIYELRTEARLTQRQLAERVGTTASVISRLEDADYEGHSLRMLHRIAASLGSRVVVTFVPLAEQPKKRPAAGKAAKEAKG